MASFNKQKLRHYCQGKELVCVEDIILDQDIIPDNGIRVEVATYLKSIGYAYNGRKRLEGVLKATWKKNQRRDDLELEIIRLEWLDKRQTRDLSTVKEMLDIGFSKEQCLTYLKMLYNSDIEQTHIVADEEREATYFAEKIEEFVDTSHAASKMLHSCAFMFYIEKYFPGLMSGDLYRDSVRKVYAKLSHDHGSSPEKLNWFSLKFYPHFLDLLGKVPDTGDNGEFKTFMIQTFLSTEFVDKLFPDGVDYFVLAGLCSIARNITTGKQIKQPFGMEDEFFQTACEYLNQLHAEYG